MKKINYLFILLLFVIFIPRVYAFTYEFDVDAGVTSVSTGTTKTVNVYIKNIKDASGGVLYCDFEVHATGGVEITGDVKSSSEWEMTNNGFYIFNALSPITSNTKIFSVPIKINSYGTLSVIDIKCYDEDIMVVSIPDIYTKFSVSTTSSGGSSNNNNGNGSSSGGNNSQTVIEIEMLDSPSDYISDMVLSEGKINFDPNTTKYTIEVSSFEDLLITPVFKDDTLRYSMVKETEGGNVVNVIISAVDGSDITYIFNVTEKPNLITSDNDGNNIWIVIILMFILLVLLYVNRNKIMNIIKKKKK